MLAVDNITCLFFIDTLYQIEDVTFIIYNSVFLSLPVLGLRCGAGFSLVVAVHELLIAVAFHCPAWTVGLAGFGSCCVWSQSCGAQAQ